jgi:hypothetical protein
VIQGTAGSSRPISSSGRGETSPALPDLDRTGRPLAPTENAPTIALDPAAIPGRGKLLREELGVAMEFDAILRRPRGTSPTSAAVPDRAAVDRLKARVKAAGCRFHLHGEPQRVHRRERRCALSAYRPRRQGIDGSRRSSTRLAGGRQPHRAARRAPQEILTAGER